MAHANDKQQTTVDTDFGQCEFVPFGAEDKIKLSFNIILRWLAVKTAKGAVPNEQDVMKFLMTCKAKRLNPFDGDAWLIGYDGKDGPVFSTVVAHQAFLKRAETHPEFDGMESGVIVQSGDEIKELVGDFFPAGARLLGGWATVFFVNRRHPMTKRLKLSTFDKGRSLWKTNPEGMIVKCAEADALRSSFPQLVGGMLLREEMGIVQGQSSSSQPAALEDRRAEDMSAPFGNVARERVFADRGGLPVNGCRTPRYEQDAAAVEASDRIRGKATGVKDVASATQSEVAAAAASTEPRRVDVFNELMGKCVTANSAAAGEVLTKEISAHLAAKSITDEEAYDLNSRLYYQLEEAGVEYSS